VHVAHVIDSLAVGGAERMLVDIANATRRDGHAVSVCISREGHLLADELHPEIPLWILGRRSRFELAPARRFAALLREHHVDILHLHGRSTFSFAALVKTMGMISTPLLLHDHYGAIEIDRSIPGWFRWGGRLLVSQYVGVYEKLGFWARQAGVPGDRVDTIGNALDLERIGKVRPIDVHREFGLREGTIVGVMVAGLRPEKGLHILLEALARCGGRHAVMVLIVGGDRNSAYAEECRETARLLGLGNVVQFVGERLDAFALALGADFALIPSLSESGPLVLIEYLAGGVPVVASRVGDIARCAEAAGIVGFVPPGEAAALAEAIEDMLTLSPDRRKERGQRGLEIARRHFDIRCMMPSWYRAYNKALGVT
jgi:glycosyltransferase involved in cell wall biosynthesis